MRRLAIAALLLMAMTWGSTYVVIKTTMDEIPAADLIAVRYTIAFAVLFLAAFRNLKMSLRTLTQGVIMGALFALGQLSQTFGLGMTDASVSGFLTGTFVIFTPMMSAFIFKKTISKRVWLAVTLAIVGLAVLSIAPGAQASGIGFGEVLTLVAAAGFAAHIVATGHFATTKNAMSLTIVQTGIVAAISWVFALPDGYVGPSTTDQWTSVLYLAIVAGALTMFLQNWAQSHIEPTMSAVVMCSEPMWAAFFAVTLGTESVTASMLFGGASIIAAMYVVVGRLPVARLRSGLGLSKQRIYALMMDTHPDRVRSILRRREQAKAPLPQGLEKVSAHVLNERV